MARARSTAPLHAAVPSSSSPWRAAVLAAALLAPLCAAAGPDAADFHRAVRLGDTTAVRGHLADGVDPATLDRNGRTALQVAIRYGRPGLARLLLEAGASPNTPDRRGWTALHHAASGGDPTLVAMMLEAGGDVGAADPYRYQPLHLAAREGHQEACEVLVAAGADPGARIDVGFTAVDLAEAFPSVQDFLRDARR